MPQGNPRSDFPLGGQDMNKNYGEGFTLKVLNEWMEKVVVKDVSKETNHA